MDSFYRYLETDKAFMYEASVYKDSLKNSHLKIYKHQPCPLLPFVQYNKMKSNILQ